MFDKLFPFHFVLDRSLRIVQKGSSLSKIVSDSVIFEEILALNYPRISIKNSFDSFIEHSGQLFTLELKGLDFWLKGRFIYEKEQDILFFCGNPWLKSNTNIKKLNLNNSDFALHSPSLENADLIQLMIDELNNSLKLGNDLENQRIFFENLFDEMPIDLAIFDEERRFRYLNKTAVKDDQLRKWMIGKTNTDYFDLKKLDSEIGQSRERYFQSAIDTDKVVSFEDVHFKNTDKEVCMLRIVSPYIAHDYKKYLLAYGLNISVEKKNIKIIDQKNTELEKLNNELNSIIYAITHDFRSPILAVKGLIELVKMNLDMSPHLDFVLNSISKNIESLDNKIIDIYNFVKHSNVELQFSEVDLKEIFTEIFSAVQHVVDYPIQLKIDIVELIPFYTDVYRLKIILNNLISNAIKYSVNRDNNAFVGLVARIDARQCSISVIDNGEGIPADLQKKVFEIYFRANNKTSGTGLGLFICTEALRKLNGTIELVSEPGKGSTFKVNLPNFKLTD
jgi:signal transduction histidine kinase